VGCRAQPASRSIHTGLTAGFHWIRLEHYEGTGNARIKLEWQQGTGAVSVIPVGNLYATFPSALTPPTPTITPSRTPTLTPTLAPVTYTLWSNAVPTPITNANAGGAAVNLGVRFRSSVNGSITGVRFYKHSGNTGTHTGYLWTNTGTFTNETASGWQTVTFSTPVSITANTVYVAAYHSATGGFSSTANYFNNAYTNGPLTALAASTQPNGRYIYGAPGLFPNATFQNANYWVAPIFTCPSNGTGLCQAPTLTPTPTPTPAICTAGAAGNAQAAANPNCTCSARVITQAQYNAYAQNNANEVRELLDMQVIHSGGMYLSYAPTINAKRYADDNYQRSYLPWGSTSNSTLIVLSRIELPGNQIWYQLDTSVGDVWIPVRYEGLNYTIDANGVLTTDPCNGLVETLSALTFPYDRRAAADYAIEHSYDTADNHGALQSSGRVTQRLPTPLPPTPPVPYAYYRYSLIGGSGVTGSAAFVSQSLWMGGMPMIWGQQDSCTVIPQGQTSLGWRYCFNYPQPPPPTPPYGDSSNPWDTHEDLYTYWTGTNSVGLQNLVLQSASSGFQLRMQGGQNDLRIFGRQTQPTEALGLIYTDLNQNPVGTINVVVQLGSGVVLNPPALSARVVQLLTNNSINNGRELQMGDYIFIDSNPVHGLLVVGWQEALSCSSAIFNDGDPNKGFRRWTITQFANNRFGPAPNMANPVPWVVDFTSPPNPNDDSLPFPYVQQTQNPVPRPFYCTMYWDSPLNPPVGYIAGVDKFSAHDWQFFTLPDQVLTDNTLLDALYVDPNWNWGANQ
jgi:hypothetical protein